MLDPTLLSMSTIYFLNDLGLQLRALLEPAAALMSLRIAIVHHQCHLSALLPAYLFPLSFCWSYCMLSTLLCEYSIYWKEFCSISLYLTRLFASESTSLEENIFYFYFVRTLCFLLPFHTTHNYYFIISMIYFYHARTSIYCFLVCNACNSFDRFNEFSSMAVQALEDVHFRGCYECLPEIMLVAGAIRNSIKDTPSGNVIFPLLKMYRVMRT